MAAKQAHGPEWHASDARHRFSEVVDAATSGTPQFVRRRDGQEVVVVSKEYFERTRPTLKSVLLNFKFEHDDGSFEPALAEGRRLMGAVLTPRFQFEPEPAHDDVRHQHRQRTARPKKVKA